MPVVLNLDKSQTFSALPNLIWQLLADTDRLNREIGLPAVKFGEAMDGSEGFSLPASAKLGKVFPVQWEELPFEWQTGQFYTLTRKFKSGPVQEMEMHLKLQEEQNSTRVWIQAKLSIQNAMFKPMLQYIITRFLDKIFSYLEASLQQKPFISASNKYPVHQKNLDRLLGKLKKDPVNPILIPFLEAHLSLAPDAQVMHIRPYELADLWQQNRSDTLTLFLYSAFHGILTLEYAILCPYCQKASEYASQIYQAGQDHHCDFCQITYEGVMDKNVEVRFSVHPNIRKARASIYCVGGPLNSPHILTQLRLRPEESRPLALPADGAGFRLRTLRRNDLAHISLDRGKTSSSIPTPPSIVLKEAGFSPKVLRLRKGQQVLQITNAAKDTVFIALEKTTYESKAATAADVITRQAFRKLFAKNLLAPGEQISIENIAILFSDLRDSTKLYEEMGDAPAYAEVRQHFQYIFHLIEQFDGSIVKTIGDAVMGVFASPHLAVACALALQKQIAHFNEKNSFKRPMVLKLGVHAGPVIAIDANQQLDYFGRHVNLAARIQKESQGKDVVLSEELARQQDIQQLFAAQQCELTYIECHLKGIQEKVRLVRVCPRPIAA